MISDLSTKLKELRKGNNLTRKQVAQRIGVSESTIGMYENGSRQPTLENLRKIAHLYKTTTDYLLDCEPTDSETLSLFGLCEEEKIYIRNLSEYFLKLKHK